MMTPAAPPTGPLQGRRTAGGPGAARRGGALLALLLVATACARQDPEAHASAVDRAACRQRADQVYTIQNREEVFLADTYASSTRDTPFAAEGLSSVVTRGLGGRYRREQMVSDCLRSTAGNVGTSPAAPDPEAMPPQ